MKRVEQSPLPLFEMEAVDPGPKRIAANSVVWSYSRRSTLEQCPRRYYYEYFGANKQTAKAELAKGQLHFLKAIQNRHLRAGALMHTAIRTYFRKAQGGDVWDASRLVRFARSIFQADRDYSRANPDGRVQAPDKYPSVLLAEYYLRDPQAEQVCLDAEERLLQTLRDFVTLDAYELYRVAGCAKVALVEESMRLEGFPADVTGRIDLAYPHNGGATIVDWKLGTEDGTGDDSLQLATYGIWATQHYGCNPGALQILKVHLGSGAIVGFDSSARVLKMAELRILQDIERMALLQTYGRDAVAEAFTPCRQSLVCGLCQYKGVCDAGDQHPDRAAGIDSVHME